MPKHLAENDSGEATLAKGRYKGETVSDVAAEDPEHLRQLLKSSWLPHAERVVIEEALAEQG